MKGQTVNRLPDWGCADKLTEVVEEMGSKTPNWLYAALDEALVAAGATATESRRREVIDRLIAAWNLEGRRFHNGKYLGYVFERLDELEGATTEPEMLRLAAAFRGALEEPGWEELASAHELGAIPAIVSLDDLTGLGIPEAGRARIESLVEQLAYHTPNQADLGARLLVDADLAALATSPQQYREFLSHFRAEALHLSEVDFLRARRHVLQHLVNRTRIFSTPIASQWEDAARENLEAELGATERKLRNLQVTLSEGEDEASHLPNRDPGVNPRLKAKGESRVLRISRAQKVACLQENPADQDLVPEQLPPSVPPTLTNDDERPSGASDTHQVATSSSAVADTSTLETVADFIENRQPRSRKQS